MTKQLEELARACPAKSFKAFIGKSSTQAILCADTGAEIVGWGGFDSSALGQQSQRKALARYIAAADPKTVLALLAELESAQQRVAELEEEFSFLMGHSDELAKELREKDTTIDELKQKLAKPVRLPDGLAQKIKDPGYYAGLNDMMNCLREQGFKFEGEE